MADSVDETEGQVAKYTPEVDRSVDGFGRPNRPPISDAESELVPATEPFDPVAEPEPRAPVIDPSPRFGSPTLATFAIWIWAFAAIFGIIAGAIERNWPMLVLGVVVALSASIAQSLIYSRSRAAVTARKGIVRLPVIRNIEMQRIGALAGVAATTCARCESFSLETGQQQLVRHGDFAKAATYLTPETMMKTKRGSGPWTEDAGFDKRGQPVDEGAGPQWSTMGACRKHGLLVFGPHSCKDWS